MALEHSDILQVIRSYRDSPGINGRNQVVEMAGTAVSIVDMIATVKSNKEVFYDIGMNACEIVANVIKRSHMPEHPTFTDSKMDALQANLRDIKDRIEKHINRKGIMKMRLPHYYFSEVKAIPECRNRLQQCRGILGFQYAEETWDNVNVLIRHVQELLEHQKQRSPEQMSIAPDASLDSSMEETGPAAEEGNSRVTPEGGGNSANHRAVDTVDASTPRLPEEGSSLIRENQTNTGGNSVSHAQIAGNATSSAIRTVINVRGSGNRLRITLQA